VFETRPEQFLRVLEQGTVATNVFLRRIHNSALDMSWVPVPVIPKRQWPAVKLCWLIGGAQGDVAHLTAEDIDWDKRVIGYHRQKTKSVALLHFDEEIEKNLRDLPQSGLLFPSLRGVRASDRATESKQRCSGSARSPL